MNTNTITRINALAAAIGLALSANVFSEVTQGVGYTIPEVRELSATGSASLTLDTPTAGSDFTPKQEMENAANTQLSITSVVATGKTNKITAQITAIENEHVDLFIKVGEGAEVSLTNGAVQTVLTDIGNFMGTKSVTYYLTATYEAGAFTESKTVTFTILDGASS